MEAEDKMMTDPSGSDDLAVRPNYDAQLANFEHGLQAFLDNLGLPAQSILVPVTERQIVIRNIQDVVARLPEDKRQQSTYISKFVAAVGVGLFDAALNYLWDETIHQLRRRVAHYDLLYFYDNAVKNPDKRRKFINEDDLVNLDDSELIVGAREIGLISEIGYRHLDYIKYMRNWASAAHPNQNQLT